MRVFKRITDLQVYLNCFAKKTIGLVPTMGALHKGHLALIQASLEQCNLTVVSIFVNPTQFAPNEDFDKYPRSLKKDSDLLQKQGVDVLFLPDIEEIYPQGIKPIIPSLPVFTKFFEGASRPTHFLGVAQVVKRLFEIVKPTHTFFGQKDYQQTLLIKWLIDKFNFEIKLEICPIVRDKKGLALSSRNQYLSESEKEKALILSEMLGEIQELVEKGERNVTKLESFLQKKRLKFPQLQFEYAVIRNKNTLKRQIKVTQNSILLLAVKVGEVKLLDNAFLILSSESRFKKA